MPAACDAEACQAAAAIRGWQSNADRGLEDQAARSWALQGEKLAAVIGLLSLIQMPAINFLAMAIKHSAHHRGQLSTCVGPMGGKDPPIYGPTAAAQ